jgi:hypothetical protein
VDEDGVISNSLAIRIDPVHSGWERKIIGTNFSARSQSARFDILLGNFQIVQVQFRENIWLHGLNGHKHFLVFMHIGFQVNDFGRKIFFDQIN